MSYCQGCADSQAEIERLTAELQTQYEYWTTHTRVAVPGSKATTRLVKTADLDAEWALVEQERDTLKRENAELRQFIDAVGSCPVCHWVIKFEGHRTLKALACETCKSIRAREALDAAKEPATS